MRERALVFEKTTGGRLRAHIGEMDCLTPPVPTSAAGFVNGHVKRKKDQKWARDYPSEEAIELLSDQARDALQDREATRIMDGCWFYNDGEPVYLTGNHYFYLTHFTLPSGGYPDFREADVKDFLWQDEIDRDPYCIGGIFIGGRQRGKTARRAARILRMALVSPNAHLGIQSKTDDDAKAILSIFIANALRNLSALIRPKSSLTSDDPKTEIVFKEVRRGRASTQSKAGYSLNSRITRRNSKANAYDGTTLKEALTDEWAKKQDHDAVERFNILSRMMWRGGRAIGKIQMPSTVDEDEGFDITSLKKLWTGADPTDLTTTGRTKNGLKRLFVSAYEAHIIDEYGRSLMEESRADIDGNCPDYATDPKGWARYWRAYPRDIRDAFRAASTSSPLNTQALQAALDEQDRHPLWLQVDLSWVDAARTQVTWTPNAVNGRFKIIPAALPEWEKLNQSLTKGEMVTQFGRVTRWVPVNLHRYASGVDPYDARQVVRQDRASKGAAYAKTKYDPSYEQVMAGDPDYHPTNAYIIEYVNRAPTPEIFYEDMVMMCHLLSMPILIENQKNKIIDYFRNRGYDLFVAKAPLAAPEPGKKARPDFLKTDGINANETTIGNYLISLISYTNGPLMADPRRMPFPHQCQDLLDADFTDLQKFDATVATGWTEEQSNAFIKPRTASGGFELAALGRIIG